jgi:uncharacterized membrane protein required for colicin V production
VGNLPDLLKQINWVDAVYILLLVAMVFRGTKTGVGAQILSLVGWIAILYLSVRYFLLVSEAIFGFMLQGWAKPLSFFAIAAAGFILLKFVERIFSVVMGAELSIIEKAGGALVAAIRSFILFGMIGFLLLLTPIDYLWFSAAKDSRSCSSFVEFDAVLYRAIDGLLVSDEEGTPERKLFRDLLNENRPYDKRKGVK